MDSQKQANIKSKISALSAEVTAVQATEKDKTPQIPVKTSIFAANYSSTPVYETIINNIAVMRRRTDNFLNATQILKVAGLDKGKRTKVLEQEFVHEEHEKIQGGYGKFQGTWVPFERGADLAVKYNVEHLIRHLLEFKPTPGEKIPEKTPNKDFVGALRRHLSGNSTGNGNGNSATQTPATKKRKEEPTTSVSDDQSKRNKTSVYRSGSRPIAPAPAPGGSTSLANNTEKSPSKQVTSSQPKPNAETEDILSELEEKHRTALCSAFMGEEWDQLPAVLTQLPSNMDFDISLDMMGNSALHWAAVLGHIKVVEFLVKKGATQTLPNHHGVTPLARAVMERYNYDYKTFPRMIVLLAPCLNHLDKYRRSVFHYVVFTAKDPERVSAALYYLKCLMDFIVERRLDAAKALNLQDEDGNTALNIAVNLGIGEIITLLHEAGANPSIPNKAGVAPEDYGPNWANPRASSSQDTIATHNSASQAINPPSGYAENFFPSSTRIGSTSLISKATQLSTMVTNFIQELEADFQHRLSVEANKCDRLQAELNEAKQTIHYLEEQLSICRPPSYFPHHIGGDNHKSGLSSSLPSQHHSFSSGYYNSYKSRDRANMPKTPQTRNTNGPKLLPSATQNLPPILPRPPVNEFNSPKITDKSSQTTTPKVGRQSSKKPPANSQPQSATPISPLSKYSTLKEVKSTQVPSNGETNEISDDEIASYTPYSIQPQAISLPRNPNKVTPPPPTESTTPGDLNTPPELKQKEKSPISKKQPPLEFDDSLEIMEDAESDSHDNLDTTQSPDYFPDH